MIALAVLLAGWTCFTSSRDVRDIAIGEDGRVAAATSGGLVTVSPDGEVAKLTVVGGLPSNEVRRVAWVGGAVAGTTPLGAFGPRAAWPVPKLPDHGMPPGSVGTHVSAWTRWQGRPLAGVFGDGLWHWDGHWSKGPPLPPGVDDTTALAASGTDLWLGTRDHGLWRLRTREWRRFAPEGEPYDHNAQSMATFEGGLYVSTLQDGLMRLRSGHWDRVMPPEISSAQPREMALVGTRLYLRHADGRVDSLEGKTWWRDVFRGQLPRTQASRLAAGGVRLFVGQWGGWSELENGTWVHRFPTQLRGVPVTALAPAPGRLWVGTQGRGAGYWDDSFHVAGEELGLTDDWVTLLTALREEVYAGTFVGGLCTWEGGHWATVPGTAGENVTDATRWQDAWVFADRNKLAVLGGSFWLPAVREAQALAVHEGALWIGSRTGLFWVQPSGDKKSPEAEAPGP